MIIAISRTILLHTVLPSPDVSPPVQSLLKSSQSSLPSSSSPPWSPPSPPSSRRPAYRSRGPTQTSMWEAGGAPSDKHFSTSDPPRALPGLPGLAGLVTSIEDKSGKSQTKENRKNAHDGFSLVSSYYVNQSCHLFLNFPPLLPLLLLLQLCSEFCRSPSMSITIGLISPPCKSSASEGGRWIHGLCA